MITRRVRRHLVSAFRGFALTFVIVLGLGAGARAIAAPVGGGGTGGSGGCLSCIDCCKGSRFPFGVVKCLAVSTDAGGFCEYCEGWGLCYTRPLVQK